MYLESNRIGRLIAGLSLCILCLGGCSNTEQNKEQGLPSDLKQLYPQQLTKFDKVDSLYFSYLGINAFLAEDNNIILAVWDPAMLLKTDFEGNTIIAKTDAGNGPGEIIDSGVPSMDAEGNFYVYDQRQSKIVIYDENLETLNEGLIKAKDGFRVSQIHSPFKNGGLLIELKKSGLAFIDNQSKVLNIYDVETGVFGDTIEIFSKPYAAVGDLLQYGASSAVQVPFSDDQLVVYKPESNTFFLFDTRTDVIAEIDSKFDTLKTITVNLPQEKVSQEELDELKRMDETLTSKDWEGIKTRMPELKAKADIMHYYKEEIWLKSNLKSEYDKWLVLDMNGEIKHAVNLPKNTFLTFVSETHLGVRLSDTEFSIFTLND